ncbi:DGQHR domain-containing protein [Rhodospirillaceae bacterium KN72]|uniref:DGQHR domain-containing protein n=1 Tax=Pacificispira spongiicola TaxID=2729598 RepID=A0A7Y0HHE1_9PROT|nr:DNA sulfur modification protein DndB [Pacificispira spongiicola]NMM45384.1 DGQHR domain-containing protein [Pacificispira spongiicola]
MITVTTPTTNFPAMQGRVGDRLVTYSTQIPPHAIEGLLGHDPRSRHWKKLPGDIEAIYSKVQRATAGQRLRGIMDYVRLRFSPRSTLIGAFPAVSIAIQNHVGFRPLAIPDTEGVGHIQIDMSSRNARIVVDGLGRLSSVLELLEMSYDESRPSDDRQQLVDLLSSFSIPVVIYAPHPESEPLSRAEMGQLFFDFNFKAVAVPPRIAISLDMSDPYIQVTNRLARESNAIKNHGGMEERAASLGAKSTAIVVQQVLLRFVRGAMEGASFQESNKAEIENPTLSAENTLEHAKAMAEFLDAFADAMGEAFSKDRKSLHLSSPGWQTIGVIYHDVVHALASKDPVETARNLAQIDWSRSGPLWSDLVVEKEHSDGTKELVLHSAGASTKREMVKKVRAALSIDSLPSESSEALI